MVLKSIVKILYFKQNTKFETFIHCGKNIKIHGVMGEKCDVGLQ